MHRQRFLYAALTLPLLGALCLASPPNPSTSESPAQATATGTESRTGQGRLVVTLGERLRAEPVTEANVNQVLWQALQAAKRGDLQAYNDPKRSLAARILEDRLSDYPQVTLRGLKPYAVHTDNSVRDLVQEVADRVLYDDEAADVHTDALSVLVQVASRADGESSTSAVGALRNYLFTQDASKREYFRKKTDLAALRRALTSYLGVFYDDNAVFLLTLLSPDPSLKPLIDSVAKRQKYDITTLVGQVAWGDGGAIEALSEHLERGEYVKYLSQSILAINEPNVLGALWKLMDNKRKIDEYPAGDPDGKHWMVPARACDFALAAFKWKFDNKRDEFGTTRPRIATDAELAEAKERYRTLINALPQVGEQVGIPRAPL